MNRRKKVRFFTLFEMLLVISLITAALGGGGFALFSALKKERFNQDVKIVISKIALCQEIMLDYDTDCALSLTQTETGLQMSLSLFGFIPDHLAQLEKRQNNLKAIKALYFDQKERKTLTLYFASSTAKVSTGQLTLKGAKSITLRLPGYPVTRGLTHKLDWKDEEQAPPYPKEAAIVPPS